MFTLCTTFVFSGVNYFLTFFHLLHFLKIFSLRPIYSMVQIIKVLCVCFCPEYLLLKFSVFLFLYELVFPDLLFSCQPQFFMCCFPIAKPHFLGVVRSFFLFFFPQFWWEHILQWFPEKVYTGSKMFARLKMPGLHPHTQWIVCQYKDS